MLQNLGCVIQYRRRGLGSFFLMHTDGAKHAIVEDNNDHASLVLDGGGEFLSVHQIFAIAGKSDDSALWCDDFGRHT